MQSLRIVVIGGGAAGFFGAVTCASAHPQAQVTLLEAGRQPLSKVRISGGGRCNVTHACFEPALLVQNYPRGSKALRGAFSRFQAKDTVAWFQSHGVKLKTESDGRMFPVTDNSETIVNCLVNAAEDAGVKLRMGTAVKFVTRQSDQSEEPPQPPLGKGGSIQGEFQDFPPLIRGARGVNPVSAKSGFEVELKTGEIFKCDRILLATGSNPQGYAIAKALGHTVESPVPSLFTFNIPDPRLRDLAGVSVNNAHLRLPEAGKTLKEQTGPLLITHWGLSGPVVLKLSAWGARFLHEHHYQTPLLVNWLPQYNEESLRQMLLAVKSQLPRRQITTSCPVPIPKRLWESLVASVGIGAEERWAEVSKKALNQLIQELTQGQYWIKGKGIFKEEFVTCGGVSLKEVDFKTMESRLVPGLYFAGEILDIDGVTGGFNFQSAWTTGWLAGQAMGLTHH
ncbi:NAD(P)/FAD-dependent oxidoreductase [Allocoleopsis sp.]|uniref:NAD(P)/FAD-dependent oxidoreductase n=1 Tax=Allocoleopsis sp. TaxID=3088169 RepID=UPI002FD00CE9